MSTGGSQPNQNTQGAQQPRGAKYSERIDHGRTRGGDLTGKAIAAIFVAVIIVGIYFGFQYFKSQENINAQINYISHEQIDEGTLGVWVDVTRNRPEETAYCIVQAYDYAKAEVGRREFALAADGRETVRAFVEIPTSAPAVAGEAYGCSSSMPPYLDPEHTIYE
ncbi:DUF4307 domain-containing protein [Corynebacterium sp. L4756]|uniref:DUF4307 domain-containing protein n=1 Tax=unclassified Corynebacterium TaxID=2624378 RepID=UPI00374CB231